MPGRFSLPSLPLRENGELRVASPDQFGVANLPGVGTKLRRRCNESHLHSMLTAFGGLAELERKLRTHAILPLCFAFPVATFSTAWP
jgi:hypothetical protein